MKARWISVSAVAGLMSALMVVMLAPTASASGWQQPRFDGGRNPFNPEETVINSDTVTDLHEIWSTNVGSGSPLLLNGVVYRARAGPSPPTTGP